MPMTLVVTSNVAPRFRGFLASVMLEIAPGVYTGPRMTKSVRERIWNVLEDWHGSIHAIAKDQEYAASIVMTWRDKNAVGGQSVLTLGLPRKTLIDVDGILLVKRELTQADTTNVAA